MIPRNINMKRDIAGYRLKVFLINSCWISISIADSKVLQYDISPENYPLHSQNSDWSVWKLKNQFRQLIDTKEADAYL